MTGGGGYGEKVNECSRSIAMPIAFCQQNKMPRVQLYSVQAPGGGVNFTGKVIHSKPDERAEHAHGSLADRCPGQPGQDGCNNQAAPDSSPDETSAPARTDLPEHSFFSVT